MLCIGVVYYVDVEEKIKNLCSELSVTAEKLTQDIFEQVKSSIAPYYLKVICDVENSKAHRPVQVWLEEEFNS